MRARRSRRTLRSRPKPEPDYDAADAADRWRAQHARARAYVAVYQRRGAIVPPEACERCGLGLRKTIYKPLTRLYAWHPDPGRQREIAWLCASCRTIVRDTREALELTWTWPGAPPAARRPIRIREEWIDAAEERVRTRPSQHAWMDGFLAAAARTVEMLYAEGARRGDRWRPTGDDATDARLRSWALHERWRRAGIAAETPRLVEPIAKPPRTRLRVDVARLDAPEETRKPFDAEAHAARTAAALAGLAAAEQLVDAANARVEAALRKLTSPRTR